MSNANNWRIDPIKFKLLLMEKHISQKALAQAIGCKQSEISRYVTGKGYAQSPKIERLTAIARELDCSIDELISIPGIHSVKAPAVDQQTLGIHYNSYGIEKITIRNQLYWQTDNPLILEQSTECARWEIPDDLAQYVAKTLALGLKQIQGLKMADRL